MENHGIPSPPNPNPHTAKQVELVLTAHPTEINRRTLLAKHQDVARRLDDLEAIERAGGPDKAGRFEADQAKKGLMRAIEALWNSDEVSRGVRGPTSPPPLNFNSVILLLSSVREEPSSMGGILCCDDLSMISNYCIRTVCFCRGR